MKKLLLSLSVLCALGLSLQASANASNLQKLRQLKKGQNAANSARTTMTTTNRAAEVTRGAETAAKAGQATSMEAMMNQQAAGLERVENGEQCALDKLGGVDTSAALERDVMKPSVCMSEISHTAKGKLGYALNRVGIYLQGVKEKFSSRLSDNHLAGSYQAFVSGLAKSIGISFNEAKNRAVQMCNSCAELNPFCGTKAVAAN